MVPEVKLQRILDEFYSEGIVRNFRFTVTTVEGSTRIINVNLNGIEINGDGYILSTNEDITDHIRTENELLMQQERLLTAEKEKSEALVKAMEVKDEFLSVVSHEFRTPLTVIISTGRSGWSTPCTDAKY